MGDILTKKCCFNLQSCRWLKKRIPIWVMHPKPDLLAILLVRFLGWWKRDPFSGESWPPNRGSKGYELNHVENKFSRTPCIPILGELNDAIEGDGQKSRWYNPLGWSKCGNSVDVYYPTILPSPYCGYKITWVASNKLLKQHMLSLQTFKDHRLKTSPFDVLCSCTYQI